MPCSSDEGYDRGAAGAAVSLFQEIGPYRNLQVGIYPERELNRFFDPVEDITISPPNTCGACAGSLVSWRSAAS
jgi:hypothetical protein